MSYRDEMSKIISVLLIGISFSASAVDLDCKWDGTGYEVVDFHDNVFGNGLYADLPLCEKALKKAKGWSVCAPHNGGAAVFSVVAKTQLGQGWYQKVETCFEAQDAGTWSHICGAESGGARIFAGFRAEALGDGVFKDVHKCFASTKNAMKGAVCGLTKTGSALLFSTESNKPMGDEVPTFETCQELIGKSVDDAICVSDDGGYRPFSLKSGNPHGPVYKTFEECREKLQ